MKKQAIIIFLFLSGPLLCQELSNIPGVFLDIGYGARPTGMGGAFTAIANDVNSILWNPAGLSRVRTQQASFFYTRQLGVIPYSMASYANSRGSSNWNHGEAMLVSGDDALRETTIYAALAYDAKSYLENLSLGFSLKYKNATFGRNPDGGQGQITGNAIGAGLDIGATYSFQTVWTALVVKELLDMVWWNSSSMGSYRQNNPPRLVLGLGFLLSSHLIIAVDFEKSLHRDTSDRLNLGTERTLFDILSLRAGAFQSLEPAAATSYSLGLGIDYAAATLGFHLDVAYLMQEIENSRRLSLTVDF